MTAALEQHRAEPRTDVPVAADSELASGRGQARTASTGCVPTKRVIPPRMTRSTHAIPSLHDEPVSATRVGKRREDNIGH
jgi:hypothetical protein